jgi:hypothetical protein
MTIMTAQIQFTVKPELLGTLGTLSGKPVSSVSPFNYIQGTTDGKAEIGQLEGLEICDARGIIRADKLAAVQALATAEAFTRIYLTTPQGVIEYIAYFAPDGTIAGVTNDSGMQLISYPATNNAMLELVRQTIGFSIYKNGSFDAHLTRSETLVLSAMIDLQRKEMLHKFADGRAAERLVHTPEAISGMLAVPPGNIQWLSSAFVDLFTRERIPKSDAMKNTLETLVTKGFAVRGNNGFTLSDDCVLLSRGHLMPSMYLTLTAGKATPSGTTNGAGFSCIISGVHDLLFIDYHADNVELQTVASAEIHDYVSAFLTNPSVLDGLSDLTVQKASASPAQGTPGKKFCPQCGAPLKQGLKFCNSCGAKIV